MRAFAVYNKKKYKTWPVLLFGVKENTEYFPLTSKSEVKAWLEVNNKIYFKDLEKKKPIKELLKSQIYTIIGPIELEDGTHDLSRVYSLSEAANLWKLSDASTVRQACLRGKFKSSEARKSDKTWLVTHEAMLRVFGPIEDDNMDRLIVNEIIWDVETQTGKLKPLL